MNVEIEDTCSQIMSKHGGPLPCTGDVFVKAGGPLMRRELREEETLRVSSGCLVGISDGVDFDVQMLKDVKNVIFGGEGLFVTKLKGPGTVWHQGKPPQRMISEIASRVPSGVIFDLERIQ